MRSERDRRLNQTDESTRATADRSNRSLLPSPSRLSCDPQARPPARSSGPIILPIRWAVHTSPSAFTSRPNPFGILFCPRPASKGAYAGYGQSD